MASQAAEGRTPLGIRSDERKAITLTNKELADLESAIRSEHHSELRWTHGWCLKLVAEVRDQREHIAKLEAALRKVIKHQPWPGDDRSERDFNEATSLVREG